MLSVFLKGEEKVNRQIDNFFYKSGTTLVMIMKLCGNRFSLGHLKIKMHSSRDIDHVKHTHFSDK